MYRRYKVFVLGFFFGLLRQVNTTVMINGSIIGDTRVSYSHTSLYITDIHNLCFVVLCSFLQAKYGFVLRPL